MSSLGGLTVYIYQDNFWNAKPVVGELHVLDSDETTLHNAGSTSQFRNISFWLLDVTQYATLEDDCRNLDTVSLTDWLGDTTNVKIRNISAEPMTDIKRPPNYSAMRCKAKLQNV